MKRQSYLFLVFIPVLVDAAAHKQAQKKVRRRSWRESFRNALTSSSGIAAVAISATVAATASAAVSIEMEQIEADKREIYRIEVAKDPEKQKQKKKQKRRKFEDCDTDLEERLWLSSLDAVSKTLGLVANSVRIAGETAGAVAATSAKIVGGVAKSTGSALDSVGKHIKTRKHKKGRRRWNVLSGGIQLIGNVVGGFGDSLLFVGSGTEKIASRAAGVAEDSIRIFGDVADATLTLTIRPETLHPDPKMITDETKQKQLQDEEQEEPPFLKYGSYAVEKLSHQDHTYRGGFCKRETIEVTSPEDELKNSFSGAMCAEDKDPAEKLWDSFLFLFEEIGGHPSIAPELFFVFCALYFISLYSFQSVKTRPSRTNLPAIEHSDFYAKLEAQRRELAEAQLPFLVRQRRRCVKAVRKNLVLAVQLLRNIVRGFLRLILDHRLLFLILYSAIWFEVCRLVQMRSVAMEQRAQATGFQNALTALATGKAPSFQESSVWLNQFLSHVWQTERLEGQCPSTQSPEYVQRGMNGGADCHRGWRRRNHRCAECVSYGGFEPYLAQSIGETMMIMLEDYRQTRPHDVAYASLHSLSLGTRPPIVRSIEVLGLKGEKMEYKVGLFFPPEGTLVLGKILLLSRLKCLSWTYQLTISVVHRRYEALEPALRHIAEYQNCS